MPRIAQGGMNCHLSLCVCTNVGYSIVAQFIVQSEDVDCISEALNVLNEWKPNWNPPFFLSDFSDAEFAALKQAFMIVNRHGCSGQEKWMGPE